MKTFSTILAIAAFAIAFSGNLGVNKVASSSSSPIQIGNHW